MLVCPQGLTRPRPAFHTALRYHHRPLDSLRKHLRWFPPQGTETRYILQHDTVTRDLHFAMQEVEKQWLDISTLPAGDHTVHLLACGNGGSFTLRIE